MALHWVAADMVTGDVIADLPSLDVTYPLRHSISNYDTTTATLTLDGAPENWEDAVQEGGSWIAGYEETDPTKSIQWCGYVSVQSRLASTDTVQLTLVTAEGYSDRRYCGDVTYPAGTGRNTIIASAAGNVIDGSEPGIPLQLAYSGAGPALTDDLIWQNTENATVLTRWLQIVQQLGGEFTIDWAWSPDKQSLVPTLRFGDRIGAALVAGFDPLVTFEMPGALLDAQQLRDYSANKGANKVVLYSAGSGSVTPYAPAQLAADFSRRPTFEFRDQPAASLSPGGLIQYARQALSILAPGARAMSLVVSLARSTGRRFGTDWFLGDDIGYRIAPVDQNGNPIRAFPGGYTGYGRAIAVEITPTTITPILAETQLYAGVS